MSNPSDRDRLAREIRDALQRGSLLEVFQLLRRTGLKEARAMVVDAQRPRAPSRPPPAAPLHGPLPGSVVQALQRGDRIDAIKLLRAHAGIGLKEASAAIDAARIAVVPARKGLSPGEIPRTGPGVLWLVVLALAALVVYRFLHGGG